MATDVHFQVRAYIRQQGETDMSKYSLDWACNASTVGGNIIFLSPPRCICMLCQKVSKSQKLHTRVIFTSQIWTRLEPPGTGWHLKRHDSLELAAWLQQTVSVARGFWKISLFGDSNADVTVRIVMNMSGDEEGESESAFLHIASLPEGHSDFSLAKFFGRETHIRIKVKRRSRNQSYYFISTLLIQPLQCRYIPNCLLRKRRRQVWLNSSACIRSASLRLPSSRGWQSQPP